MRGASEEGVALIAVLWMLVLLSLVAASLSWETRSSARIARNMADIAAARSAADAGIQRAILDLLISPGVPVTARKFRADGTVYVWRFANCTVYFSIKDELGKVDLNQAPEALLAAMFASVGVDSDKAQSLADAVADFRDEDNLRRPSGAEEADYQAAGLPWGPKNAPFQTVEELKQVLGITGTIYQRVAPYLTIYSPTGAVNTTIAGDKLIGILRKANVNSQYFVSSLGNTYSIRAEGRSSAGAVFVRDVIVQLTQEGTAPWILSWGQENPDQSARR